MRNIIAATLAASLLATASFADGLPLPAGTPAGVKGAQTYDDDTVLYVIGVAAIAVGIAALASNGHSHISGGTSGGSGGGGSGGGGGTTTTTTTT